MKRQLPNYGEVWLVQMPNKPDDKHQPRTAIIVSQSERNQRSSDVIVVPTTSSVSVFRNLTHVFVPKGQGGLLKDSYARCDQITTLDNSLLVRGPLGPVVESRYLDEIIRAIGRSVGDGRG